MSSSEDVEGDEGAAYLTGDSEDEEPVDEGEPENNGQSEERSRYLAAFNDLRLLGNRKSEDDSDYEDDPEDDAEGHTEDRDYPKFSELLENERYGLIIDGIIQGKISVSQDDMNLLIENIQIYHPFEEGIYWNYYILFGSDQDVMRTVKQIDEMFIRAFGFYTMDGFEKFVRKISKYGVLDNKLIKSLTYRIDWIAASMLDNFDIRTVKFAPDRFWVGAESHIRDVMIVNVDRYSVIPVFDPHQVIATMNQNGMSIGIASTSLIAKINSYLIKRKECVHIIKDFDETYLDYLVQSFINDEIRIDFTKSSFQFREAFRQLYFDTIGDRNVSDVISSVNFLLVPRGNNKKQIYEFRGKLAFLVDTLKLLKGNNIDELIDEMTEIIDKCIRRDNYGIYIIDAMTLVNKYSDIEFNVYSQYLEYMMTSRGIKTNFSFESGNHVIEGLDINSYLNYFYELIGDESEGGWSNVIVLLLDMIFHLSRGTRETQILSQSETPLFRWMAEIRSTKAKRATRR